MVSQDDLQFAFHKNADSKRFWNRIRNPFLLNKEQYLASMIATNIPGDGKNILEIGCGEGSNLYFFKKQVKDPNLTPD